MKTRTKPGGKSMAALIQEAGGSPVGILAKSGPDLAPVGEQAVTVVTSIVGACGRFIIPLEPWLTADFHKACQRAGLDPSEVLAEVCHAKILAMTKKGGRA